MKKISTVNELIKEKGIKIFVINYEPLKDRRDYLKKRFKDLKLDKFINWYIQKPDKHIKKINFISQKFSEEIWKERIAFVDGPSKANPLNNGDLNLIFNHLDIYKEIIKEQNKIALILEDDVILNDDFLERLKTCLMKIPKEFDIAYTDAGMHLRLNKNINKMNFFRYWGFLTRTTASYFISNKGAKKYLKVINPGLPIDLNMRYFEKKKNLKVFWLKGYLTYQGSIYGNHYLTVLQKEREKPSPLKSILFEVESNRFNKKIFWITTLFILDYLFIIPYRSVRIIFKKVNLLKSHFTWFLIQKEPNST